MALVLKVPLPWLQNELPSDIKHFIPEPMSIIIFLTLTLDSWATASANESNLSAKSREVRVQLPGAEEERWRKYSD